MEEKKNTPAESPASGVEPKIVKEKSKFPKLSKWIIIAAVVVLVIILAITAYFINKTLSKDEISDPASNSTLNQSENLKTYTNEKYNFSIEYPSDWSYREYPDTQDGAAFNPVAKPGYPDSSDSISISVGQKIGNYVDDPFEDYVKIAASAEIQNYGKIASIKTISTADGTLGYETTWMVQPMAVMGQPPTTGETESLPITYFELPNSKTLLVRVYLNRKEDLGTYEKMLKTVKFNVLKKRYSNSNGRRGGSFEKRYKKIYSPKE